MIWSNVGGHFLSQMIKKEDNSPNFEEALLSVWRQVLVERRKRVVVGDDSYPVQSTAKRKLAQVDFDFAGQHIRALEQNPATASRWAALAAKAPRSCNSSSPAATSPP